MSVVDSWIAAETAHGEPISNAIDSLNASLGGRHYTHSSISRWRTGARPLPPAVYRYMLDLCIYRVLLGADVLHEAVNSSTAKWRPVVDDLSPPQQISTRKKRQAVAKN